MAIRLSDIKDLLITYKSTTSWEENTPDGLIHKGFNKALELQGSKEIGHNREKLAYELYVHCTDRRVCGMIERLIQKDWDLCDVKGKFYSMADAIIASEATLLEVKK